MRKTGYLKVSTPSDRELAMSRVFEAPRALVFRAWTDPERLPRWMMGPEDWTMTVCDIDLRAGGTWHFAWRHADGTEMEMRGEYLEVAPPGRLDSTESWGGEWPDTINTLTLSEKDGRTRLTVVILYPSKKARDAALKTGMPKGVAASFDRLDALLTSEVAEWAEREAGEA